MPTTLFVTRGLPGSGKTTWALQMVSQEISAAGHRAVDPRIARVNRDDLRAMMHGGRRGRQWQEQQVTVAQHAAVRALLQAGISVVADDTNLPDGTIKERQKIAAECGALLRIVDLRDVPLDTCISRDAARGAAGGRLVGEEVIRQMAARQGRVNVR